MGENSPMQIDAGVNLKPYNTFGLPAVAKTLVRITSDADVRRVVDDKALGRAPKFILGGGSNIILTRDMPQVVLKVEVRGMRLVEERADAWIVEAGAGESWHDFVDFTLEQGWPGLENLALIPGTVGAAPVQNIGAYGVELKERFESLDAVDLVTGRSVTLGAGICAFAYRDSVFKHSLAGRSLITRVRFRLPRPWQPVLGYLELQKKISETGIDSPDARQIFDWVVRDPPRQAARPGRDRQRRQLLQEPGRHARAVPRHHRPRPGDRPLPDARRQRQARRRLDDRRLRLEGKVGRPGRRLRDARRSSSSTAAPPSARR